MLSFRDVNPSLRRLVPLARTTAADPALQPCIPLEEERGRRRQRTVVLSLLAVVVVVDQSAKWWAWRHFPWTVINSGGDVLVGHTIGAWYAAPFPGALLDLLDFGLLSLVASVLARCRVSARVYVPGALITGGWVSNTLDRLGLHYWTAPGSVRGAVDFIHLGPNIYNIADFFIIGGTPLFLLGAACEAVRAVRRRSAAGSASPPARVRTRMRVPALAGAGLILVVALGAVNYGGVSAPPRKTTALPALSRQHHLVRTRGRDQNRP
jgi:lipoprotein signal peptidase